MKTIHIVTKENPARTEILGAFTSFSKASDFAAGENSATIHECRVNDVEKPIERTWELKQNG